MKKSLIIFFFSSILIFTISLGYKVISATETVTVIADEINIQKTKETYLTSYGYTIDNPNIILDPYSVSPLTALIIFETETSVPVTVTIKGKDENSSYTNTFESSTKHYLPIYGLYPDTLNEIDITCNDKTYTYTIQTAPISVDITKEEVTNDTNSLYFISSDTYPYALDNNNDIRWYLTKNYSGDLTPLSNGNFLLGNSTTISTNLPTSLVEIDLLGKIYKQYNLGTFYYGSYLETDTSLVILSSSLLEIDKQTGTITTEITLNDQYSTLTKNDDGDEITLQNSTSTLNINLLTSKQTATTTQDTNQKDQVVISLYQTKTNYKLTKGVTYTLSTPTKTSSKSFFLIGYKSPDQTYQNYDISITQTKDTIEITGAFTENDEVYLILDKFPNKKVYNLKQSQNVITIQNLSGKYSLYLKINGTLYKTNSYVVF